MKSKVTEVTQIDCVETLQQMFYLSRDQTRNTGLEGL